MVSHTTMMDFISILIMFLHIHRFLTIPSDFQMIPMEDIIYSLDSQLMSLQLVWMCLTIPTGRSVCFVLTCSATSVCAPIALWASYLVERVCDWNFVQVEFADVLRIVMYDACAQKTRRSLCLFYQICFGDWSLHFTQIAVLLSYEVWRWMKSVSWHAAHSHFLIGFKREHFGRA